MGNRGTSNEMVDLWTIKIGAIHESKTRISQRVNKTSKLLLD